MKCQRDYSRHAGLADRLDWNILTSFVFSNVTDRTEWVEIISEEILCIFLFTNFSFNLCNTYILRYVKVWIFYEAQKI